MSDQALIVKYKNEINAQLADQETMQTLITTTFNNMDASVVKRAMLEGYMRGFTFENFIKKDVYAIPFRDSYSLVTSIDYARKVGMKSGVVGKSAPTFTKDEDGKIESCSVTIEKKVSDHIGNFTATVFMQEYSTGKQQWASKPRTMLAKVAEMHALRMACPEQAQQMYTEEEYQMEAVVQEYKEKEIDTSETYKKIEACTSLGDLQMIWITLSPQEKKDLQEIKEEVKTKLTPPRPDLQPVDDIIEAQVEEVPEESEVKKAMREGMAKAKSE